MVTVEAFNTDVKPQWCPGCGNFGLLTALKNALVEVGAEPKDTVCVTGIGCSGKTCHYINSYGFESLHGRSLPVASGIRLANHKLNVLAMGGDGDGYGIGSAHFLHVMRRNYDMVYIVHNNGVYGLTTGQAAPTSIKGMKTKSTPHGVIDNQFNPIAVAIANGATFVARGYAGDIPHLTKIFTEAIRHRGFALIDVFQPCVTFNALNTYQWFQQRVYKLEEKGHDPKDRKAALERAFEDAESNYERVPIGIFYRENAPTYEEQLPQLKEKPIVEQVVETPDMEKAFEDFM